MRKLKQTLAAVLCVCTLLSADSMRLLAADSMDTEMTAAYTEELGTENVEAENTESSIADQLETTESVTESTEIENTMTAAESVKSQNPDSSTLDTELQVDTELQAQADFLMEYLVIENGEVSTPGSQYVLVGINNEDQLIQSAQLIYRNTTTNENYSVDADVIDADALLFRMAFSDDTWTGTYEVTSITCTTAQGDCTIDVTSTGVDATFGVNQVVETAEDAQIVTEEQVQEESGISDVVVTDADGQALSTSEFANAVESAGEGNAESGVASTGAGNLVIVLDPGHGGGDSGASYYGLQEKNLNLAIALACRDELNKYAGVTVYMTRTDDTRPGWDVQSSLDERVNIAKRYKANVLISIHNNAAGSSAAGAMVFYPNPSYNYGMSATGSGLSNKILQKLVELGLANNGIKIRNSECGDTYPDGSLADYYGLIRRGKYAGIPTIIVEHAFLTNYGDVVNHLSTSEQLKAIGVADATGIANYYGLIKGDPKITLKSATSDSSNSVKLTWSKNKHMDGYQIYRSTAKNGTYKRIKTISKNSTTSYTDKKLKAGQIYYYKVRGYKGPTTFTFSNKLKVYPLEATTLKSAVSVTTGQLKLTWTKVKKAAGYRIYRSTSKNGTYQRLKTIKKNSTVSYTDKTAKAGTAYYYKIITYSTQNEKTGYGSYSAKMKGVTVAATTLKSITPQQSGYLKLTWKKVTGAKSYQIYRATSKNGKYAKIATTKNGTTVTYVDKKAKAGTVYYYKIRTTNYLNKRYGYSKYSNLMAGRQLATPSVSVTSTDSKSIELNWKKIAGAEGYRIYRATTAKGTYTRLKTIYGASTLNYTDTKKLQAGQEYFYKVCAIDTKTISKKVTVTGLSAYSTAVSAWVLAEPVLDDIRENEEQTALTISWPAVVGAEGYRVYRKDSDTNTYELLTGVSVLDATTNHYSYTDTIEDVTVSNGVTYTYKIQAYAGDEILSVESDGKSIIFEYTPKDSETVQ